jgi:hypothetical protein
VAWPGKGESTQLIHFYDDYFSMVAKNTADIPLRNTRKHKFKNYFIYRNYLVGELIFHHPF